MQVEPDGLEMLFSSKYLEENSFTAFSVFGIIRKIMRHDFPHFFKFDLLKVTT